MIIVSQDKISKKENRSVKGLVLVKILRKNYTVEELINSSDARETRYEG